jgi:hypothetical protein
LGNTFNFFSRQRSTSLSFFADVWAVFVSGDVLADDVGANELAWAPGAA